MAKQNEMTATIVHTSIYMEHQTTGDNYYPKITMCQMHDGAFVAVKPSGNDNIIFAGISQGSSVINRMVGADYSEMVDLLIRAVNNRTRQRNYFRLQNSLLEGLISEEDFYKEIEEKEDDYVIEEVETPTPERIRHAIMLSQGIKDIQNSEDLSTLFSFSSAVTDNELKKIEANGSL